MLHFYYLVLKNDEHKLQLPQIDNNITVLSKGNSKGLIASIPIGGHWAPNSTVGDNALWKKAQNIAKKNNPSDTMNRITPILSPFEQLKYDYLNMYLLK